MRVFASMRSPSQRQETLRNRSHSALQRKPAPRRQPLLQATPTAEESFAEFATPSFAQDFTRIPVHAQAPTEMTAQAAEFGNRFYASKVNEEPYPSFSNSADQDQSSLTSSHVGLNSNKFFKLSGGATDQSEPSATSETDMDDKDQEIVSQESDKPLSDVGEPAPPATVPDASGECPTGTAWVPGKHVTPDFVLDKQPPIIVTNRTPSETEILDSTFTGQVTVDCDAKVWRYQLDSVESKGIMKIVYRPKDHYPAPSPMDDTGELTNVNKDNWEAINDDLDENKDGYGGYWLSYRAVDDHEAFHWKTAWQEEFKKELPEAESEMEKLKVSFTKAPTAKDAEEPLLRKAGRLIKRARGRALDSCFDIGDEPGTPPYKAQEDAIERLIQRIKDYATSKGWR